MLAPPRAKVATTFSSRFIVFNSATSFKTCSPKYCKYAFSSRIIVFNSATEGGCKSSTAQGNTFSSRFIVFNSATDENVDFYPCAGVAFQFTLHCFQLCNHLPMPIPNYHDALLSVHASLFSTLQLLIASDVEYLRIRGFQFMPHCFELCNNQRRQK